MINVVDNNVAIINLATHAVSLVAAGINPVAMEINLLTNKLYVANFGGKVTVLDGATNTGKNVAVASTPSAIAINPNTNKSFVANINTTRCR